MLIQIRGEGLADENGQGLEPSDKLIYILHPNCSVEEM